MDDFANLPSHASLLLGKTVAELVLGEREVELGFILDDGSGVAWTAEGDCCSETWFADIVGMDALLGSPVLGVQTIQMSQIGYVCDEARARQEKDGDQAYGERISTARGECLIVYRNSSNGYYGGSMSESSRDPAGFDGWSQVADDYGAPAECAMPQWHARRVAAAIDKELGSAAGLLTDPRPGRFKSL